MLGFLSSKEREREPVEYRISSLRQGERGASKCRVFSRPRREGANKCRVSYQPRSGMDRMSAGFPLGWKGEGFPGRRIRKRRNKKAGFPSNIREGAKWIHRNL